jgi:hypothetical protein
MRDRLVSTPRSQYTASVRKSLVVGAIATVVIGIAAYLFWQPREGSIDWHKREFVNGTKTTLLDRLVHRNGVPAMFQRWCDTRKMSALVFHERALIQAGYWKQSPFVLSNGWPPILRLDFHINGCVFNDQQ